MRGSIMTVNRRLRIATVIALLCIRKLILDGLPLLQAPFWYSLRGRYAIWKNLQALKLFPYYPSSALAKVTQLKATLQCTGFPLLILTQKQQTENKEKK